MSVPINHFFASPIPAPKLNFEGFIMFIFVVTTSLTSKDASEPLFE